MTEPILYPFGYKYNVIFLFYTLWGIKTPVLPFGRREPLNKL